MTASSKLEIKKVNRLNLWYNKYRYKLVIADNNLRILNYCNDYDSYVNRLSRTVIRYKDRTMAKPYSDPYLVPNYFNEKLIKSIYELKNSGNAKFRLENNYLSIFCDDLSSYKKITKCKAQNMELQEALAMPDGVIYFKKHTPPAKHRIYMSGKEVPKELKYELRDYLSKNLDINASTILYRYVLNHDSVFSRAHPTFYADRAYYLNYDNEHHVMMLHILFPNMFGKNYKLEKMSG